MKLQGKGTADIFNGIDSKAARHVLPRELHHKAGQLLDRLNAATSPDDLRTPARNRLEKLRGDRAGQLSLRINDKFRICFTWTSEEPENVHIVDYH